MPSYENLELFTSKRLATEQSDMMHNIYQNCDINFKHELYLHLLLILSLYMYQQSILFDIS